MTRRDEKPFILFHRSRFIYNIMPRNASGWQQIGIWMALLVPIMVVFNEYVADRPDGPELYPALVAFLLATTVWAIGGIMWTRARAEVVDIQELLRLKREQERKRRRR